MGEDQDSIVNSVSLWSSELVIPLLTGLTVAPGTAEYVHLSNELSSSYSDDHNPTGLPLYQPSYPNAQRALKCSHCNSTFASREEQVNHYKLDWHRFNLKRNLDGLSAVTEEQFLNHSWIYQDDSEDSSDHESESEVEDDASESGDEEESQPVKRKPRYFFVNADGDIVSIYKNVLQHKKAETFSQNELVYKICAARHKLYWIVLLVGGGHFAGAVFKGADVIVHKTFHSYTVRAKQGGSQSSKDNKNATSHPKSAGASLRRYNEQSHNQHIQELLCEWKNHFSECDVIFFRCPRSNNNLFAKENPIAVKTDTRLRTIPFPTKKSNFQEVKRVHRKLSQIYVHGKFDAQKQEFYKSQKKNIPPRKNDSNPIEKTPDRSPRPRGKSPNKSPLKLSKSEIASLQTQDIVGSSYSSSDDDDDGEDGELDELVESFETFSTDNLKSYGSFVPRNNRKKEENNQRKDETQKKDSELFLSQRKIENFIYSTVRTGNLSQLEVFCDFLKEKDLTCVPDLLPSYIVKAIMEIEEDFDVFGMTFGEHEKGILHVAAENGHKDLIWWLLERGCDPSNPNRNGDPPYRATKVKSSKLQFRRFMADFPDKYDYKTAGIPAPLSKEQEAQQKQKLIKKKEKQRKAKQEKEKRTKQIQKQILKEKEEQEKFLKLSDREKRALAAEKRMSIGAQHTNTSRDSVLRCFSCAKDMSNIVPFEYFEFKFCSTSCLREHRMKAKAL